MEEFATSNPLALGKSILDMSSSFPLKCHWQMSRTGCTCYNIYTSELCHTILADFCLLDLPSTTHSGPADLHHNGRRCTNSTTPWDISRNARLWYVLLDPQFAGSWMLWCRCEGIYLVVGPQAFLVLRQKQLDKSLMIYLYSTMIVTFILISFVGASSMLDMRCLINL